jgi:hypothetical protein
MAKFHPGDVSDPGPGEASHDPHSPFGCHRLGRVGFMACGRRRCVGASRMAWHQWLGSHLYADPRPSVVSGCVMVWDTPPNWVSYRSTMLWVWDHQMLKVGVYGSASLDLKWRLGRRSDESSPVKVTVDGEILFTYPTIGVMTDIPPLGGITLVIAPSFVSWDRNDEDRDTGLETAAIFARLRSGRVLDVKVYDQHYLQDLKGVGSSRPVPEVPELCSRCAVN